ncbi:DNA-binding protein [Thiothrix eikelboomii]|uniref:DNA-binding protein n=1 Tax=Thiothrix eikelboomii TaxID=92487 RepID=UPI003BAF40A0
MSGQPLKKRGRPKGASSATISEVRQQAAEEKRQLKSEYNNKIIELETTLEALQVQYDADFLRLEQELEVLRKRELYYQQALGVRLEEVAMHLYDTLINWGDAELAEAQIDKRKRGRPRKTLK